MEHLINLVKAKTGITDDQAKEAVSMVMTQLKSKLPAALHPELDKIADGGDFGDAFKEKMEEMRDKMEGAAKTFGVKAEGFVDEMRNKFQEFFDQKGKTKTDSN